MRHFSSPKKYIFSLESVVNALLYGRLSFSLEDCWAKFFPLHRMFHMNSADLFSSTMCNFMGLFTKAHLLLLIKTPTNQHFKGLLDYQSKCVETTIPKFRLFATTTVLNCL